MVGEDALVDLAAERADKGRAGQILLAGQINHEMNTSNGRNPAVLLNSYPHGQILTVARPSRQLAGPGLPFGRDVRDTARCWLGADRPGRQ